MEDNIYDFIILGTGIKECILAGLLTKFEEKKVVQIDKNLYYGGQGASINLTNLWKHFRNEEKYPSQYGENRDWNVDLVPKVLMSSGSLVKILIKTNVSQYLEFKCLDSKFVSKGELHKIPSNDKEALQSDLLDLKEKLNCTNFFQYILGFKVNDVNTYQGHDINAPFRDFVKAFNFEETTIEFIGYAVAHEINDEYLASPAINTIKKIQLYLDSAGKYGDTPYIYPVYGLSGIPEGFSRLCAINGGITILGKNADEIIFDSNGRFSAIKSDSETFYGKALISDPTYLISQGKVVNKGKVIRAICLLDHPITNTNNVNSGQIFFTKKQSKRNNDISLIFLNHTFSVCKKGFYVVFITTIYEGGDAKNEIAPAIEILGNILETFITVSDLWEPKDCSGNDGVYVTSSLTVESNFEKDVKDILDIYKKITGKDLSLEEI